MSGKITSVFFVKIAMTQFIFFLWPPSIAPTSSSSCPFWLLDDRCHPNHLPSLFPFALLGLFLWDEWLLEPQKAPLHWGQSRHAIRRLLMSCFRSFGSFRRIACKPFRTFNILPLFWHLHDIPNMKKFESCTLFYSHTVKELFAKLFCHLHHFAIVVSQ